MYLVVWSGAVSERVKTFQVFPLVNKEGRRNAWVVLSGSRHGDRVWSTRCLLGGQHLYFELNCVLQKDMLKS